MELLMPTFIVVGPNMGWVVIDGVFMVGGTNLDVNVFVVGILLGAVDVGHGSSECIGHARQYDRRCVQCIMNSSKR